MTNPGEQPQTVQAREGFSAFGPARATVQGGPLSAEELRRIDASWQASLYLYLGMLYLKDNSLLKEPLTPEHVKPRLLSHWGSDAGQCFTYIHFNRLINKDDLNAIYISGPGHGAPAVLSQSSGPRKDGLGRWTGQRWRSVLTAEPGKKL
jgi:xylulose-5-phosphate/fructose-6-phosphate phosphoketolase